MAEEVKIGIGGLHPLHLPWNFFFPKFSVLLISELWYFRSHQDMLLNWSPYNIAERNPASPESSRSFSIDLPGGKVSTSAAEGGTTYLIFRFINFEHVEKAEQFCTGTLPQPAKLSKNCFAFNSHCPCRGLAGCVEAAMQQNLESPGVTVPSWVPLEPPLPPHHAAHSCWWEPPSRPFWGKGLGFATLRSF